MSPLPRCKLLPHEWCFGGFLIVHWLRLVAAAGVLDPHALLYAALLIANIAVIARCLRHETDLRWKVRLWFYPVAMNAAFFTMGQTVAKVFTGRCDGALAAIDRACFGDLLSVRAGTIASPFLTEISSFCYFLFFPYLVVSWFYGAWRGVPLLRRLFTGIFTIYGIGFLGYSLVPAAGPYLAFPDAFAGPLQGWGVTRLNAAVVASGSNGVDVFPSLHCAVSAYLLFFDRRHAPWRYRLYLIPCVGLWFATVYLRYHYFADVVAGFALAAFALRMAMRPEHNFSNESGSGCNATPTTNLT
jgi:hypothetical protein